MHKKVSLLIAVLLALMLGAAQCQSTPAPTEAPSEPTQAPAQTQPEATKAPAEAPAEPAAPAEKFRVALVLPSPITDMAWGESIYDSLVSLQKELGGEDAMEIAYSEGMFNVTDAAAAIRMAHSTAHRCLKLRPTSPTPASRGEPPPIPVPTKASPTFLPMKPAPSRAGSSTACLPPISPNRMCWVWSVR